MPTFPEAIPKANPRTWPIPDHSVARNRSAICKGLGLRDYLEGHGDLVSRLMIRITRVTIWVIGVINLLTKSP